MLEVELFYLSGIDFMGSFMSSYGCKCKVLIMDYISKWVDVVALAVTE